MAPEITLEVQPLSLNSGYYPWTLLSGAYNSGIIFLWIYDSSIQFTHQPSRLLSHVKLVHKTPHTVKWDLGGDVAQHPPKVNIMIDHPPTHTQTHPRRKGEQKACWSADVTPGSPQTTACSCLARTAAALIKGDPLSFSPCPLSEQWSAQRIKKTENLPRF